MKVPVQVMVGGKKVKVEYLEELDPAENRGEMVCYDQVIRVSQALNRTERQIFSTLFHELIHFAFEVTGHSAEWDNAKEEPIVYALEGMLADLLVFSPDAKVKYRDVPWPDED